MNYRNFLSTYKYLSIIHRNTISINLNDTKKMNDIKDYIYTSDSLIILYNITFNMEIKFIFESFANNKIYLFLYESDNIYGPVGNKNLSVNFCND